MSKTKYSQGFTLLEIIVAMMIFTVLSVLAHQGLTVVLDYNSRSRDNYSEQTDLHRVSAILLQDLMHIRQRPSRDRLGGQLRPYTTEDPDYDIVFTRGGLPSIVGSSFGGLQRVAYSISEDKELIRWTWPTLDAFVDEDPRAQVIIKAVNRITFEQLNTNNVFEGNWPPLNVNIPITGLPRMIRVELELENGLTLERLYPGVEAAPVPQPKSAGGSGVGTGQGGTNDDQSLSSDTEDQDEG